LAKHNSPVSAVHKSCPAECRSLEAKSPSRNSQQFITVFAVDHHLSSSYQRPPSLLAYCPTIYVWVFQAVFPFRLHCRKHVRFSACRIVLHISALLFYLI